MEDETIDNSELESLAERLVELREEKRYVEGEIEGVSARLAAAIGEGAKRTLGAVEVRIGQARPGLRVVSAGDVPAEFMTLKPDRTHLMDHIRTTGEVPAGVEVTEGRPIVYAKSAADPATDPAAKE